MITVFAEITRWALIVGRKALSGLYYKIAIQEK